MSGRGSVRNSRGFVMIGIVIAAAVALILCLSLVRSYFSAAVSPVPGPAAAITGADDNAPAHPIRPIAVAEDAKKKFEDIEARRYQELETLTQ